MSGDNGEKSAAASAPEPEWVRRKRRALLLGELLPEQTSDDREPRGASPQESAGDRWLREQVPPHHGG